MSNKREEIAKENGMSIEFVNWFFENKKDGCGNVWFLMMAAMWESWKPLEQQLAESQRELRSADATIENLQMQVEKMAAENAGMDAFVDALLSIVWQGGSADGAEIQGMALKHGLLRQEVYSADEHENLVDDPGNFEDGDQVYFRVETPATDAFLAEVRASGVEMFALMYAEEAIKSDSISIGWRARVSRTVQ